MPRTRGGREPALLHPGENSSFLFPPFSPSTRKTSSAQGFVKTKFVTGARQTNFPPLQVSRSICHTHTQKAEFLFPTTFPFGPSAAGRELVCFFPLRRKKINNKKKILFYFFTLLKTEWGDKRAPAAATLTCEMEKGDLVISGHGCAKARQLFQGIHQPGLCPLHI